MKRRRDHDVQVRMYAAGRQVEKKVVIGFSRIIFLQTYKH